MNDKRIVAQYLYDLAKESKTEFLEDASLDVEIKEAAKKINLSIPNPDIAVFRTVWAKCDSSANLNGVRLPRKVVEEGLNTLLFKQVNFEHKGAYNLCGLTIDAKIKDDKIETINIFYKSIYPDEFEELKEKIKTGEAAVSFEIWSINPETKKSVLKTLADGTKEFVKFLAHGTGLLLINPPAEPSAKIFKLVAKNLTDKAKEFVNHKFEEELIYAQLAIEEPKEKEEIKVELEKLFANVTKEEEITFDIAMAYYYASEEEKAKLTEDAAKWTKKFINDLPDSAFAAIEPSYPEKTEDKNARHLPHHNGEGDLGKEKSNANLDLPHYKNALARVNQINPISDSISADDLRAKASAHLERHKDALEKATEIVQVNIDNKDTTTKVEIVNDKKKVRVLEEYVSVYDTQYKEDGAVSETKSSWKSKVNTFFVDGTNEEKENSGEGENKYYQEKIKTTVKAEETKVEVTPEVKKEDAQPLEVIEPKVIVKTTHIFSEIRVDTYVDGTPSGTQTVSGLEKTITEYSDGTKDEIETVAEIKKKFELSEVEEKVNAAKAEKDAEIATLKTEQEKVLGEKDKEITNLKQELGKKDQEIAKLKQSEDEPKKEKEMTVGSVEPEKQSEIKKQADNINKIIASKHNQ